MILTCPQKHDTRAGSDRTGSPKPLPLPYHFTQMGWRPCVGAGITCTRFSSIEFVPAVENALKPSIDRNSAGLSVQTRVDVPIGDGWLPNVDARKAQIRNDAFSLGAHAGSFRVDPLLVGMGVGKRF